MTNQELFDIVKTHLLTQNAKSMAFVGRESGNTDEVCAYRGSEGRKCAIGVLIPDDKYDPKMEGNSVFGPKVVAAAGISHTVSSTGLVQIRTNTDKQLHLASDLQATHDSFKVENWPDRLTTIAESFGLNT